MTTLLHAAAHPIVHSNLGPKKIFQVKKKSYQILAAMLNLASHEIKMSIVCEISAAIGQLSKNS